MKNDSLSSKTRNGLFWSFTERLGTQFVQFVFGVIIARILTPESYGLIAMPLFFLALAQSLIDNGFASALVRKEELKEEDLSTAFFFNIVVGVVCYLVLFISSPWIASFYEEPILSKLLKFTALATIFNPLCVVQQAILTRKIDFKTQTYVTLSGSLFSGFIGLLLAYSGYGVWALVFQQVGGYATRTILFWLLVRWRPSMVWSCESFRYLWGYGSRMLVASILDTGFKNIYPLIIGKVYNANDLGYFTRAQGFANLPSATLTSMLQRVTFPVLSSMMNENERLAINYRKILRLTTWVVFPIMLGLSAVADPFVRVLLTDKWEGCIILLQIVCFNLMWYPVHAININLLQVKGRSDLFLRLEIIKKILTIVVILSTYKFGVVGLTLGGVFSSLIALFINTYYTGILINVGYKRQMKDITPIFISAFIMWAIIILLIKIFTNLYLQLFIGIITGVFIYALFSLTWLRSEYREAITFLFSKK